jgi:hypothetical protein
VLILSVTNTHPHTYTHAPLTLSLCDKAELYIRDYLTFSFALPLSDTIMCILIVCLYFPIKIGSCDSKIISICFISRHQYRYDAICVTVLLWNRKTLFLIEKDKIVLIDEMDRQTSRQIYSWTNLQTDC